MTRTTLGLAGLFTSATLAIGALPAIAATPDGESAATPARTLTSDDVDALTWRSVGPANMGGRVAAVAFAPSDSKTWYVGYATGGLWKTTNAGTTFSPVFDKETTSSIGSIGVADAPVDWIGWDDMDEPPAIEERGEAGRSKIVWVGTGEGNGRNSSSWGAGVYRSIDGGGSFEYKGLKDAHDMPALAVHPVDPDVCFIAALGHLWGPNETRGVYRTIDGGENWEAVLQIDENTGACDVAIDPNDPDTVFAAMYMRRRSIGSYQSGGPEGGIYRSQDAGRTWEKLANGLPERTGRIGLSIFPGDSNIIYATIESDVGGRHADTWSNRSRAGGVYRSDDGGDTWTRTTDFNPRPFYFSRIYVDPVDSSRVYLLGWQVYVSDDAGKNFRAGVGHVMHVDFHALAIDPADPDRLLVGNDGGLYESHDKGKTWRWFNEMAVGQFYNVAVDNSDPYRVGGGLQDNGSWIGPSDSRKHDAGSFMGRAGGITNSDWDFIMGGDGFHVAFDPLDPNIAYAEWQGGNIVRIHLDTGEIRDIRPFPKEGEKRFRFNWNAPFFVSPHEPTTLYLGGNHVFRLTERGDKWERISGDLSTQNLDLILAVGSEAETAGTITSLAESPVQEGILWAGTDDGLVHVSLDAGVTWNDVTPSYVGGLYISCIETSSHERDTAYVTVDGHRSDVMTPLVLMTTDAGQTWDNITGDLPDGGPPETIREDPRNPDVLYVGTEHASYVTIDRGQIWVKLNGKTLPTVAVDDLQIQAREMDLVAGTHGRSIWILDDISPLSQLDQEALESPLHLFHPMPARPHYRMPYGGLWSDSMFIGQNPNPGAAITYWLRDMTDEKVNIRISNDRDTVVRELSGPGSAGLNRIFWDIQADPKQRLGNPDNMPEYVPPGVYKVVISFGENSAETTIKVEASPSYGASSGAAEGGAGR